MREYTSTIIITEDVNMEKYIYNISARNPFRRESVVG